MTELEELEQILIPDLVNKALTLKKNKNTIVVDRISVDTFRNKVVLILFCKDNLRYQFTLDTFSNHIL
jgi:hypothetical protein